MLLVGISSAQEQLLDNLAVAAGASQPQSTDAVFVDCFHVGAFSQKQQHSWTIARRCSRDR